jgi:hypothetical protein
VDFVAAVVADEQSLEVVQPGEGTFDDPAGAAEPGAVRGVSSRDLVFDPARAQLPAVLVVVVATIGGEAVGSPTRSADLATHRRDALEERDQLGDVVAVAARNRPGERDPACVDQEVVLGAVSGSINRARARFGAPFFACT